MQHFSLISFYLSLNYFDAEMLICTLFLQYYTGEPCRLSGFPVRTQSGRGSTQLRSNPGPFRAHVSLKLGLKVESYFHTNISRKFNEFVRICELVNKTYRLIYNYGEIQIRSLSDQRQDWIKLD